MCESNLPSGHLIHANAHGERYGAEEQEYRPRECSTEVSNKSGRSAKNQRLSRHLHVEIEY